MTGKKSATISRRSFMRWATVGWAGLLGASVAGGAAAVRMMFPNVSQPAAVPPIFEAGKLNAIRSGTVDERFKDDDKVWLVREPHRVFALIAECPHDACVPDWHSDDSVFECPCCGSTFDREGIHLEGPAGRSLERASIRLEPGGGVLVDRSKRFREENGGWENSDAFLNV